MFVLLSRKLSRTKYLLFLLLFWPGLCIPTGASVFQTEATVIDSVDQMIWKGEFKDALASTNYNLPGLTYDVETTVHLRIKRAEIFLETGYSDSALHDLQSARKKLTDYRITNTGIMFDYYLMQAKLNNYNRFFDAAGQFLSRAWEQLENSGSHDSISYSKYYREMAFTSFWHFETTKAADFYQMAEHGFRIRINPKNCIKG